MKKAKVMLMLIAVLAVVGGALAFKAKKFSIKYCYATTVNNAAKTCNANIAFSKPGEVAPGFTYYYTTLKSDGVTPVDVIGDCPSTACPSTTLTIEN